MNHIFFWIIITAIVFAATQQFIWLPSVENLNSPMSLLTQALIDAAGQSVTMAIGLIGTMCFFLGLMKIAESGGLLQVIANIMHPLLVRLFPSVPANHPAMGAMVMNLSANALGLGNAATPFGIRAMQSLQELNTQRDTLSHAMILFLGINTSSITLLPTGIVALRAASGSMDAAGIIPTTLFATICSTTVAILTAKWFERRHNRQHKIATIKNTPQAHEGYPLWVCYLTLFSVIALIPLTIVYGTQVSPWVIPMITFSIMLYGKYKKVPLYERFVEGAKEGIQVAWNIIPYLVAILCAIALFRASGALSVLVHYIGMVTTPLGFPAEALPMAFLRPLSGSGAYALVADVFNNPQLGPDSFVGYLVSTIQGSTETTFYVLAVYCGAVQIKRFGPAVMVGLMADMAGIIASAFIVHQLYGTL